MNPFFDHIIEKQGCVILDGALATELEKRGANLNHTLWSAKLLIENPALIKQVHLDYLHAGAAIITTATYQASFEGFAKEGYSKKETEHLMNLSVTLAREAIDEFLNTISSAQSQAPLVAASIGPYGAALADGSEYRGNYNVSIEKLMEFHKHRLDLLARSNADILAFETIPCLEEAFAIKELLKMYPQSQAWVSFSCKDEMHLCSGALFSEAVELLNGSPNIIGVGVNCTAPHYIEALIKIAAAVTDKYIIVYPNKGEAYNSNTKTWEPTENCHLSFVDHAQIWKAAGAKVIGGCCRTSPDDILQLKNSWK
ncbi:MAG: homocysteine S-methyltransferase [Burkholderiaceae bacterium]